MSCSGSSNCCEQPIQSACLAKQNYTISTTGATIFGPNPIQVAATGVLSNDSSTSASLTFTFRRGATIVAAYTLTSGQLRSFTVPAFTSISATATVASAVADLCMTEFFRLAI
ncbi:S-Ena type endospore appendage [Paenibacillus sp. FSL H8-0034]|uniref:S-Ena type endospore appendage n=1 Tax=Paenibacillus sp. FSL H8-0034 TaxID=2954671 RepID=UPI0040469C46